MILFSSRGRQDREAAERLYAAVVAQARQPTFYSDWGVPDTLDGRFEMMALHLFAVTHRLMSESDGDPNVAQLLSETFVADMDSAFREMGVGDLSVPKRIKTLYRSYGGRMTAYGTGLREGPAALVEAIGRNVFPDGDPGRGALLLATYLDASVGALADAPLAEIRGGSLPFPPPESIGTKEQSR
jgi:cytochrome b pre-mRNA-processing protein 3